MKQSASYNIFKGFDDTTNNASLLKLSSKRILINICTSAIKIIVTGVTIYTQVQTQVFFLKLLLFSTLPKNSILS